jgi:hypothetical protein
MVEEKEKEIIGYFTDSLLIYEGGEVIRRERIRKMTAGCRHCKGYFSFEMNLIV